MTNPTLQIALTNNTGSSNSYAYITGLSLTQNNRPVFIQADGTSTYYPDSPSTILQPLSADVAISLGAPGSTRTVTIPQIAGGRIWFAVDGQLGFRVNPGPAIVEPSVTNTSDPSYSVNWGFCEFTFNSVQLFVNISFVDFVSLPIALELRSESGGVQSVGGLVAGGLDAVCSKLVAQDQQDNAGWSKLVIKAPDGSNLRALSPNSGRVMGLGVSDGYYQPYVDAVWQKYSSDTLTINTQAQWGNVAGNVVNGLLTFPGVGTFSQPSAGDVFSCSTGPFGNYAGDVAQMGAIGARIAAALNRSTLLVDSNQPEGEQVASYYHPAGGAATNHYARIVHETSAGGRGYAFPYDDVGPSSGGDQSGSASDGAPALLTVTVGGVRGAAAAASTVATAAAVPEDTAPQKTLKSQQEEEAQQKSKRQSFVGSKVSGLRRWASSAKQRLTGKSK